MPVITELTMKTTLRMIFRRSLTLWSCLVILLMAVYQPGIQDSQPASAGPQVCLGAVEGFVRLEGNVVPLPTRVENTTDPKVCGRMQTLEDLLVSARTRGIQNVIVALTDVPASKIPASHPGQLILDNQECKFIPHVSVLMVGSTIQATNSDQTLHNTHFYGAITANIALPYKGLTATRIVDKPGMIIVKCDVHGWMQAFIRVDSHPFHVVTDENGYFRIPDIPAGTYNLEIWHEILGLQQRTIHIKSTKTERIEVKYSLGNH